METLDFDETIDDFDGVLENEFYFDSEFSEDIDFSESDFYDFKPEYFKDLAEQVNLDVEGMSEEEVQTYLEQTFSEALPAAIIPIIKALAPVAIQYLAPMAIQAVSGLINHATKKQPSRTTASANRPPAKRPQTNIVATTQRPPAAVSQRPVGGIVTSASGQDVLNVNSLINLLQSPAVINAIASIASQSSGLSQSGSADPQVGNLLLNTISQLAANARSEMFGGMEENYPDFLFDGFGNLIVDPYAPDQVAEKLIENLNH